MQINISDIRRHKGDYIPFSFRVADPENEEDGLQFVPGQPLLVEGTVTNTGNGYLVVGNVRGAIVLPCGRCLHDYEWAFDIPLAERYCTETDWQYWTERLDAEGDELEDEADDMHLFSGDVLDIAAAVFEQVFVSLPMRGLCDDDCRGLCDQCGTNLNETTCRCRKNDVDIRLAPLAALLADDDDDHLN